MSDFHANLEKNVRLLVYGYINIKVCIWIPDYIVDIIFKFHGTYNISFESDILIQDKISLMKLICNQLNKNVILTRLYSGINDGFEAKIFHQLCDNQGPTLTLITNTTTDGIFGGFTSKEWTTPRTFKSYKDKSAFLFQIYPNKIIFEQKFNTHVAVFHKEPYMVGWSSYCDLVIKDECNINTNSYAWPCDYNFNYAYQLIGGLSQKSGKVHFTVKNIEIFHVNMK